MKIHILLLLMLSQNSLYSQDFKLVEFKELQKEAMNSGETILIYNFWATWCKPCIEELPAFEKVNKDFSGKNVKVVLVNLDFNSKVESVTRPFIKAKNLHSSVYHITDTDPNEWIDKIDTSWSGAIPATVIYFRGEKFFFKEGQMNEAELKDEIKKIMEQ